MLFADNTALVGNSAHNLQKLLELTEDRLKIKCFRVNVHKSNVVIINKRNNKCESRFYFEGSEIQVEDLESWVEDSITIFQSNGRWNLHIKEKLTRGRIPMFTIFQNNVIGIKNCHYTEGSFHLELWPFYITEQRFGGMRKRLS